ncbi:hypothetical protein GCM10011506_30130 [Marivirga lumbricoides]|uniref:Uncharacterized protein n=1 Tax=Marivirga lumbricoides TaxID=1046115 RepID=A0ABQ1MLC7_9BACT|nr:hypothetical protein GCM10011506_30130 [Marivirga lumbricoides]
MELHRLDGITASGLDNLDIQDIDFETLEEGKINGHQLEALEALGYIKEPEIAYEILDEAGNVIMYADAEENLYVMDGLGELGFLKKIGKGLKKATSFVGKKIIKPVATGVKNAAKFTGNKILKPVVSTVNRYMNPATILLRNGFLLAMKTNLMKVAERLRFGYLSEAEARKRGMNMSGFAKLKEAISKADKIYELAGGKKENLKKAILTGKGNNDKAVPLNGFGLGSPLDFTEEFADPFERMVVEMDADEIESMLQGSLEMEGLGVVVTGTAIAAASGAVASISALLSKITGVFDKGKAQVSQIKESISQTVNNLKPALPALPSSGNASAVAPVVRQLPQSSSQVPVKSVPGLPAVKTASLKPSAPFAAAKSTSPGNQAMIASSATQPMIIASAEKAPGFIQKNKTVLIVGAGLILASGGVYYVVKQSKEKKKSAKSLNGISRDSKGRFKTKNNNKPAKRKAKPAKKLVPTVLL